MGLSILVFLGSIIMMCIWSCVGSSAVASRHSLTAVWTLHLGHWLLSGSCATVLQSVAPAAGPVLAQLVGGWLVDGVGCLV